MKTLLKNRGRKVKILPPPFPLVTKYYHLSPLANLDAAKTLTNLIRLIFFIFLPPFSFIYLIDLYKQI